MTQKIVSKKLLVVVLGIIVSILAACAPAGPTTAPTAPTANTEVPAATVEPASDEISLTDALGRQVSLAGPAQRIISLAPSQTEILFALGAGDRVVGRDTFSDYPEEALAVLDIGGGFGELNMEVILAQTPDLILASSLTPPEQIQALETAGQTVYALPDPNDFNGMYANLRTVARLVGQEAEAETMISDLQARVAAVEEKMSAVTERPLVFYELDGTDPAAVWTPGPGTFIDTMIRMAGGENLGADLQGEWVQVSLEELIARDPDLILLGDATWGGVTVESVAARAGWEELQAVQEGRVYPFDDNLVSRPGPRLVDGLEAFAMRLHPELFQ